MLLDWREDSPGFSPVPVVSKSKDMQQKQQQTNYSIKKKSLQSCRLKFNFKMKFSPFLPTFHFHRLTQRMLLSKGRIFFTYHRHQYRY